MLIFMTYFCTYMEVFRCPEQQTRAHASKFQQAFRAVFYCIYIHDDDGWMDGDTTLLHMIILFA